MLLDRLVERPGDLSFCKTKLEDEKGALFSQLEVYSFSSLFFSLSSECTTEDRSTNKPTQYASELPQEFFICSVRS